MVKDSPLSIVREKLWPGRDSAWIFGCSLRSCPSLPWKLWIAEPGEEEKRTGMILKFFVDVGSEADSVIIFFNLLSTSEEKILSMGSSKVKCVVLHDTMEQSAA